MQYRKKWCSINLMMFIQTPNTASSERETSFNCIILLITYKFYKLTRHKKECAEYIFSCRSCSQNNFNVIETDLFADLKYMVQCESITANEPIEREREGESRYGMAWTILQSIASIFKPLALNNNKHAVYCNWDPLHLCILLGAKTSGNK